MGIWYILNENDSISGPYSLTEYTTKINKGKTHILQNYITIDSIQIKLSTVFLSMDHNSYQSSSKDPVLFETMIFIIGKINTHHPLFKFHNYIIRYKYINEARRQHKFMLKLFKKIKKEYEQ